MKFFKSRSHQLNTLKTISSLTSTVAVFSLFGCFNANEITLTSIASTSSSSTATTSSTASTVVTAIAVTQQPPAAALPGTSFGNVTAELRNSSNVVVSSSSDAVTLSAHTDSSCATAAAGVLSATSALTTNAVNGVATFTSVSYSASETIYLQFRSGSLSACSSAISVSSATAYQYDLNTVPSILLDIANNQCVGYYLKIKDAVASPYSLGIPVNASFTIGGGANGNFYSTGDLSCAGTSSSTQSVSSATNFIPFKNTDTFSTYNNLSLTISASGLVTGDTTPTINVRARPMGVAGGHNHTCSILENGAVQCWGQNASGQLGNGTILTKYVPTQVSGIVAGGSATGVATGYYHTCARMGVSGGAKCWGSNTSGQLGNGTIIDSNHPIPVAGVVVGKTLTRIAGGGYHTCATTTTNMYCWGDNAWKQLGDGTNTNSPYPQTVSIIGSASDISAGFAHTCAVASGTIYCWGQNYDGQVGQTNTAQNYSTPQTVSISGVPLQVVAGRIHSCALSSNGYVYCWGGNVYNQSGVSTNETTCASSGVCNITPVTVSGVSNAVQIYRGSDHTCAVIGPNGNLKCWGTNIDGQSGDPSNVGLWGNAVAVKNASSTPIDGTQTLTSNSENSLSSAASCIVINGLVHCFGSNAAGSLGDNNVVNPLTTIPIVIRKWQ